MAAEGDSNEGSRPLDMTEYATLTVNAAFCDFTFRVTMAFGIISLKALSVLHTAQEFKKPSLNMILLANKSQILLSPFSYNRFSHLTTRHVQIL